VQGRQTNWLTLFTTRFRILILPCLLAVAISTVGQDTHFAETEEMNTWYNPALKTNLQPLTHIHFRNVNYPGIVSYTSKAATIELPLIGRDKDETDIIPFMHLSGGINIDNSKDGFMNVSTAMLSFSYALPLNGDNTYLAAGFQATYTFSRVGLGGNLHYPEQFDQYGAMGPAIAADPYQSGYSYGYFTAGVGTAVFHNGAKRQWYVGASIRHLNKPYTEWTHAARLAANNGIQAGYTVAVTEEDAIGGYVNASWQGTTHQQILGLHYSRIIDDSTKSAVSLSVGYRNSDALVPGLSIQTGRSRLAFFYEIDLSGIAFSNYKRKAFEFSYTLHL